MLRVTAIDPGAVTLATGSVSLRRFEQRPNETLVVGQLLDAPVRIADTGERRRSSSTPRWSPPGPGTGWSGGSPCGSAAAGWPGAAEAQVVAWRAVTGLSLTDRQGTAGLLAVLETMRPADVAATLRELPEKRRHEVVDALDDERLADVFEELSEYDQRELLAHLGRGPGRGRPGGDGPRRRGRPARASCPPPSRTGCSS